MKGDSNASRRWHLYAVNFSHITSYYAILPMIPYLNMEMGISGLMYALSFSGYYITQLLSYLYFGSVSDRIGRRNTLLISLCGLSICNLICFASSNTYVYVAMRTVSGLFDCVISITQAYVADISSIKDRSICLAKLESVMNAGQCVGPFIAGLISIKSVLYAIYFGIACEFIGFFYAIVFLPESVESVLERRKLVQTFNMVRRANRRMLMKNHLGLGAGLKEGLLNEANREVDAIQRQFMSNLKKEEKTRMEGAKLEMNYLIVIVLVCEFCNKFVFSLFDTIVCQYGEKYHALTSFQFSLLSAGGSAINIVQTGYLFRWFIYSRNMSIPRVGCLAGITGVIACVICIYGNTPLFWLGGILLIVAYGFYAPVAPSIMSAESNELTHGKALSLVQLGSQCAYILSPILLEQMFTEQKDLPFFISMIPAFLLATLMFMCEYLPGGKNAGQVSLQASLENDAKMEIMNGDNEYETDYLGSTENDNDTKNGKKTMAHSIRRHANSIVTDDVEDHYANHDDLLNSFSPVMANRMSITRNTLYGSMSGEEMEI